MGGELTITLSELFSLAGLTSYQKNMGTFGIEIETETKAEYSTPSFEFWNFHGDGSLRNFGVEYVLKHPLNYGRIDYALKEFEEKLSGVKFLESSYTSVHVHMNFVDRTLSQLFNFFTLYALFENVLTRYCGPDRDGNLFCLKMSNAEGNFFEIIGLKKAIREGNGASYVRHLNENALKYSGLNIAPLRRFGSVEVRTHPGTTDIKVVKRWIDILNGLYQGAQRFENPSAIITRIHNDSIYTGEVGAARNLFRSIIPSEHLKHFNIDSKEFEEDINDCLWYAYEIARGDFWDNFGRERPRRPRENFVKRTLDDVDEVNYLTAVYQDLELGWTPYEGLYMYEAQADI